MEKDPVLELMPSNDTFSLKCTFQPITMVGIRYNYTVKWYVKDEPVATVNMENNTYVSVINREDIGVIQYGSEVQSYN